MRKAAIIAVLVVIITALSGCKQIARGRTEIDKLFIVRLVSIDEGQDGRIKVTLTTKSLAQGGAGSETQQKGESIVAEGETILEAVRSLQAYSDRKPNFGHTEFILFGEAIARKGIQPYIDFFSRTSDVRNSAKLYIVKGSTANDLVTETNTTKMFIGDRLVSIEETVPGTGLSSTVTLNEAMLILDNKQLGLFLPFLEMTDTRTIEEQQQNIRDVLFKGYALFGQDKLHGFTSEEEARGINWIMDRIRSGIIVVRSKRGDKVSLEIVDSKVKLQPRIADNKLYCTVKLSFITNIGEVMGNENVIKNDIIRYLLEQQEKIVMNEVKKTLKTAQEHNADHLSIISKFIMKYPMLREYFMDSWKELFPDIIFDVQVESMIKGTYLVNEPTGSSEEAEGE